MSRSDRQLQTRQRGVGLLEVMVAVLVLAVGVLGVAALQAVALKNVGSSASTGNATIQVYTMLDILRANRANVCNYNTNGFAQASSGAAGTKNGWLAGLKTAVAADAKGSVDCDCTTRVCTVGVQWNDERGTGGSSSQTIEATSQI